MSEKPETGNDCKDETKASLMNFVSESVNYVAVIATAIATMSRAFKKAAEKPELQIQLRHR